MEINTREDESYRTKKVEIKYTYVEDLIIAEVIGLQKVSTSNKV